MSNKLVSLSKGSEPSKDPEPRIVVGNKQYSSPIATSWSSIVSQHQPQTRSTINKTNSTNAMRYAPKLTSSSSTDEYSPLDSEGNPRTSIHGIPIVHNESNQCYELMYTFPAYFAPALRTKYPQINLPVPTPGGSIQLFIQAPTLSELLQTYQQYFSVVYRARNAHKPTHFFGVPLGPSSAQAYNFSGQNLLPVDRDGYAIEQETPVFGTNNAAKTTDFRFVTKFMASDSAIQYGQMIDKWQIHCANLVDQYAASKTSQQSAQLDRELQQRISGNIATNGKKPFVAQTTIGDAFYRSRMPVGKLHCTMLMCKIFSLDELQAVEAAITDQGLRRIIYDAIGGTSIILTSTQVSRWNSKQNDPTMFNEATAHHIVLNIKEVGKPGKQTAADHVPTADNTTDDASTKPPGDDQADEATAAPAAKAQACPRLALVVGLLSDALLTTGCLTQTEVKRQKLGTKDGQKCGILWHSTLFNAKYSKDPTFSLPTVPLIRQISNIKTRIGNHRVPAVNLYRMSSAYDLDTLDETQYDRNYATAWLPPRNHMKDCYVIESSIPMP